VTPALLEVGGHQQWRTWLRRNHDSVSEIWLVFRKGGAPALSYEDAICEALCWGWVDSLIKRLDDERYARKFTPRKLDSRWSTLNRRRYEEMRKRGLLQKPGIDRPPTDRNGDTPKVAGFPSYIEKALRSDPRVWSEWERLAPSCRRQYLGWIDSAKKDETKQRRLAEALARVSTGQKLAMK
jgi:uncharacterized protein YdeI (YjbR/CyaY-like superfamily)